jgi:hypothetical protein
MNAIFGTSSGSGKQGKQEITMKDLFKCLTAIEGIMVPMLKRLAWMEETMRLRASSRRFYTSP